MSKQLVVTSSPHIQASYTTSTLMRDVLLALLPTLVAATIIFGARALVLSGVCVAFSVFFEYAYRKLMHLTCTVGDLSAAVTGLLLAFNLPVGMPLWMAVIGCFVAVVIVKQLFGGIGKNFANPAIVGRIVLFLSFPTAMTTWLLPKNSVTPEAVIGATPLALPDAVTGATAVAGATAVTGATAVAGATPLALQSAMPSYLDMFLGRMGGCIGETCALTLLLGLVYLVCRKVITVTTPLAYIGTVFVLSFVLGANPVFHILAGGLMLGAIFMATDYVTTPTTERGKLVFGVGAGLITVMIRLYGLYPEGVSFAILLMNIATPHIDNLTTIKAFGGAKNRG